LKAIPRRFGREGRVSGRVPVSLLLVKVMPTRDFIWEKALGISPEMFVWRMKKCSSFVNMAMEGGIEPMRLGIWSKERVLREGMSMMEGGIGRGSGMSKLERLRWFTL
jgi:hypothetical protein